MTFFENIIFLFLIYNKYTGFFIMGQGQSSSQNFNVPVNATNGISGTTAEFESGVIQNISGTNADFTGGINVGQTGTFNSDVNVSGVLTTNGIIGPILSTQPMIATNQNIVSNGINSFGGVTDLIEEDKYYFVENKQIKEEEFLRLQREEKLKRITK